MARVLTYRHEGQAFRWTGRLRRALFSVAILVGIILSGRQAIRVGSAWLTRRYFEQCCNFFGDRGGTIAIVGGERQGEVVTLKPGSGAVPRCWMRLAKRLPSMGWEPNGRTAFRETRWRDAVQVGSFVGTVFLHRRSEQGASSELVAIDTLVQTIAGGKQSRTVVSFVSSVCGEPYQRTGTINITVLPQPKFVLAPGDELRVVRGDVDLAISAFHFIIVVNGTEHRIDGQLRGGAIFLTSDSVMLDDAGYWYSPRVLKEIMQEEHSAQSR